MAARKAKGKKARGKREKIGHRPSEICPEIVASIVQSIERGCYAVTAARVAGIHKATYYRWLERGENEESGIYRDFRDALEIADAKAEQRASERLAMLADHAMPTTPGPLVTYLERRFPERWSRNERRDVNLANNGKPLALIVQVTGDTDAGVRA